MLPKPSDWLQALCLFVFFNAWAYFQYWLWGQNAALLLIFLLSPLSHPWLAINILILPIMVLCYTHWFLWGKEGTGFPAWLPSPDSWIYSTLQWTSILFSAALATYPLLFLAMGIEDGLNSGPEEGFLIVCTIVWTAAFLYLLALTAKGRRLLKGKPKPPKPPL
ncbi:MAG: hypothetical protein ACK5CA_15025 [Cyanobacteriota bacterium]|jgi:hypothetical protein